MALREKDALGALGDCFIGIRGEDGEKFRAVFGRERCAAGANRQLPFRARMTGADFFAQLGANGSLPRRI
ncbi:MAG: hypothetical protein WB780_07575 [Candidatus Acidiferrales bacterium]